LKIIFGIFNSLSKIKDSRFIRGAIYSFILNNIDDIFGSGIEVFESKEDNSNAYSHKELLHFHKVILSMLSDKKSSIIKEKVAKYMERTNLDYFKIFYKNGFRSISSETSSNLLSLSKPSSNENFDFSDLNRNSPKKLKFLLKEDIQILFQIYIQVHFNFSLQNVPFDWTQSTLCILRKINSDLDEALRDKQREGWMMRGYFEVVNAAKRKWSCYSKTWLQGCTVNEIEQEFESVLAKFRILKEILNKKDMNEYKLIFGN
jgi:hypothetical protein